jgi:hypothetical protein
MKLISGLCHPLIIATYLSITLLVGASEVFTFPYRMVQYLILIVFLTTCVIPAFSIFILKSFSWITDLELTNRKDRLLPFVFIFIWYAVSSYLFISRLQLGKPFSTIFISVTVLVGILIVITKWFKISIHAAAIWSAVGIIVSLVLKMGISMPLVLVVAILLAGLTSSSRLYLGYHQPKEVWSGAILGFGFSMLAVYFFG